MPERVRFFLDGESVESRAGVSVAAAVWNARGISGLRSSPRHSSPRGPLCAMGTCFECRVTIDGRPHVRACLVPIADGMAVEGLGSDR